MTDKQIDKWLRRQFSPLGWSLTGYYGVMTALAMLGMVQEAMKQLRLDPGEPDLDALMNNAWGYIVAVLVGLVILHGWKGPGYWRQEILVKEGSMTAPAFFSILCLCVGAQMVNGFWISGLEAIANRSGRSFLPMLESVSGSAGSFSMFLYASILAPVSEELIFRGFVLRSLRPYGKQFAIVGSAVLFGLFHGNLLQTPYAFLMGLLLGYTAVEYSVLWAIGVHLFNNLLLADLLTRLTEILPPMAADALNLALLGGCLILSMVLLAVRRREIAAYFQEAWIDRRVLKCFFTNAGVIVLIILTVVNILTMLP